MCGHRALCHDAGWEYFRTQLSMSDVTRILCPVDFSGTSEHALDFALHLAAALHAYVQVAYVFALGKAGIVDDVLQLEPDLVLRLQEQLRHRLEEMLARHLNPGVEMESVIIQGEPPREIGRAAVELGADLIVMGTHGRSGLEHVLLGSVAEKVVRTAAVPVITVPPEGRDSRGPQRA